MNLSKNYIFYNVIDRVCLGEVGGKGMREPCFDAF